MIKTYQMLLEELSHYQAPVQKLIRMIQSGHYMKLTKGLYETDPKTPGYLLANAIYGPSYLSFEFALSYYGLIPEAVVQFTSATFKKRKTKTFSNYFGVFSYRDIPEKAFPYEIILKEEQGYTYQIASAEKALCDQLYTMKPVKNKRELNALLFEDLRIDEYEFKNLNVDIIMKLCEYYPSTNLKILKKVVGGRHEYSITTNDATIFNE